MSDPIHPVPPPREDRRRTVRRRADQASCAGQEEARLPVVAGPPAAPKDPPAPAGASGFNAHLMGQDGQKRGLRGGPPVLQKARASYLTAEWSGPQDRRPPAGLIKKTDI